MSVRLVVKKLLRSIREHQPDVSLSLFFAAGVIGLSLQIRYPAEGGAEMMTLARNIAAHGTFANPFPTLNTGTTAMNPPLYPLMVAGLIKVLRIPSLVWAATIAGSILANAVTAVLLLRVSCLFFGDVMPGLAASILWLGVMPASPGWDTSYTVMGLLFFCLLTHSAMDRANNIGALAAGGVVGGLLFLLNPSSLLISLPWVGYLAWKQKRHFYHSLKYCGIVVAVIFIFVAGWSVRNHLRLGTFAVRTNLGMTLYASNNDCAESSVARDSWNGCYQAHNPWMSVREAELLRNIGEAQYDRSRIAETKKWVKANPGKFLKLTAARVVEFWFPPAETIPASVADNTHDTWFVTWQSRQNGIAYAVWIITALSLPGFVCMARNREPVRVFVLLVLALYPLLYYVVVSDIRYRYPVLWLSLLSAGYLVCEALLPLEENRNIER